jgi:hypothetical protein
MDPKTHEKRLELREAVLGEARVANISAELDRG